MKAAKDQQLGKRERERQWWLGATDAGRHALKIGAVAIPLLKREWIDAVAAAAALTLANRTCALAKHFTSEVRPDGSDDESFPSSHSLDAFCAATSLTVSSGWSVGLPAYVAAGSIAYGRLRADRHHNVDVIVGGIAGFLSGLLAAQAAGRARQKLPAPFASDPHHAGHRGVKPRETLVPCDKEQRPAERQRA
jgi:membrane-associated phospholipid phosphatase